MNGDRNVVELTGEVMMVRGDNGRSTLVAELVAASMLRKYQEP